MMETEITTNRMETARPQSISQPSTYPEKKLDASHIDNYEQITRQLAGNDEYLRRLMPLVLSEDGMKAVDFLIPTYMKMLSVKDTKFDAEAKIKQLRSIAKTQKHTDSAFTKFRARLDRMTLLHDLQKKELQLLRYLFGKMRHESEANVLKHIQKYHVFYQQKFDEYKDSDIRGDIEYLMHILSGKEQAWLQSKITGIEGFVVNPSKFIDDIETEAKDQHMTQDERFLAKLRKLEDKAKALHPEYRQRLDREAELVKQQIPEADYGYRDVSTVAKRTLELLRNLRKQDPQVSEFIRKSPRLRHLLTYETEIKDLLAHLTTIPESEKFLDERGEMALPTELRNIASSKTDRTWKNFMKFYHEIDKKSVRNLFIEKYGDPETYKILVATKQQYHLWPKMWGEVIAKRLNALYQANSAKEAILASRDNLLRFFENRKSRIDTELRDIAEDVRAMLDKKLKDIGKESETAYTELEKALKARIGKITEGVDKKFNSLIKDISTLKRNREELWERMREQYRHAIAEYMNYSSLHAEHSAKLHDSIPNPGQISNLAGNVYHQRLGVYGDLIALLGGVETLAKEPRPRINADEYHEAWSQRTQILHKSEKAIDRTIEKSTQYTEGEGYLAFQRLYTLAWRTLSMQREILQMMYAQGFSARLTKSRILISDWQ